MSGGRAVSRRLGVRKIFNASRSGEHVPMAYETEGAGWRSPRSLLSPPRRMNQPAAPYCFFF